MTVEKQVGIMGGGLAGALMATFLGKAGYRVDVYERRADMRRESVGGGRSINLALSTRGIAALEAVGLISILDQAIPMRGRMIHGADGSLNFQPYSKNPDDAIYSISRMGLNRALLTAAEANSSTTLHFNQTLKTIDLETGSAIVVDSVSGTEQSIQRDFLIGSDGAFSAMRRRLQERDRFDYQQQYLSHGYKELTILPSSTSETSSRFAMEPNALHIWPRSSFMLIALPNIDGSFTCTLFAPFEGRDSFSELTTRETIRRFFAHYFPDAISLMPDVVEMFQRNPTSSLMTVRCGPWYVDDRFVMIGDACHAVVPFYGQGMNAAFEDCLVLSECLSRPVERQNAFREYYALCKPNVDALADLAIANFVEMRDHVNSPMFRFKKQMEHTLHRLFPSWYLPLYSMVSFSRIPYAEAKARADRQHRRVIQLAFVFAIAIMALVIFFLLND